MKAMLSTALILMLAVFCAGCSASAGFQSMSMEKAQEAIEAGTDYLIVDVRTQEEYDKGHIPGALLLPIEDIREGKLDPLPDKKQKLMLYCWTGRRSEDAAALLAEDGYTNVCNIGGFVDWHGETEGGEDAS